MPLASPLTMDGDVLVETGGTSAADADMTRFEVKADMRLWVDVDYSNPTRARLLLEAEEVIDTDDQATIDILTACPEMTLVGPTPP